MALTLAEADLPADLILVVIGKGRVKHVADSAPTGDIRENPTTWCDMYVNTVFNELNGIRLASDEDVDKDICGGCSRSLRARLVRLEMAE